MDSWECPNCNGKLGKDVFPIVSETIELTTHNYAIGLEGYADGMYVWEKGNPSSGKSRGKRLQSDITCSVCYADLSPELVMGYFLTREVNKLIREENNDDPTRD